MLDPVVSVLIPSRNERFLQSTILDLLAKAAGPVEVIAVLDGYWPPAEEIISDKRVRYIHRGQPLGMRAGINAAAAIAKGRYLLKADAHCLFDVGWDQKLAADCDDDWVVVPRRKRLDAENWCIQDNGKPDIDYMYLSYPDDPADFGGPGLNGKTWENMNRRADLKNVLIDDLMSAQGSAWFMAKSYFDYLELMDEANYGTFWNEFQEIGLKCWLSGGRVIVNKKTWYAHLHKGKKYGRGYYLDEKWLLQGRNYTMKWLTNSAWHKQTLPLSWLIEHFWPVPSWPENYRDVLGPEFYSLDKTAHTTIVPAVKVAPVQTKVYVDAPIESRGVQRVAKALRAHAPATVAVVDDAKQADLVVLHVVGRQDRIRAQAEKLLAEGKRYAVIQYCLRSTMRPKVDGWLPIWRGAEAVWSYYDLPALCAEDGFEPDFDFYHSPLGVDASTFRPVLDLAERRLTVVTSGLSWLTESVRECASAAWWLDERAYHVGPNVHPKLPSSTDLTDYELAAVYSQAKYVSGLRRVEGFELPAAEGLLCGSRPILFDRPHYRKWYEPFGLFIPETPRWQVIEELKDIFSRPYVPVTDEEIAEARIRFDWATILKGFWEAVDGDA